MPTKTDFIFLVGLLMLGTGIAYEWGWPLGLIVIGGIVTLMAVTAKFRGHD